MAEYGIYTHPETLKATDLGTISDRDDEAIRQYCVAASRDWDSLCRGRRFYPTLETRYYDMPPDTYKLRLRDDLLEITSIVTGNGTKTLTSTNYWLKSGSRYERGPYNMVVIDPLSVDFLDWSTTPMRSQQVTGYWGYHERWDTAFTNTNATVTTDSGSTIVVSDTAGVDEMLLSPRFRTYCTIKLSDGTDVEYALVTGIDFNTKTLTLIRGINGTTQVTATGAIYRYEPMEEVERAVRRLAAWYYRMKDTSRPDLDRPIFTDEGIILPPRFPIDISEAAKKYAVYDIAIL